MLIEPNKITKNFLEQIDKYLWTGRGSKIFKSWVGDDSLSRI